MADLRGMLVAEREDEEEEDLKDLVGEMELDEAAATAFRAAIGAIVLPKKDEPKTEPELEPEPEPEPEPNPWLELLTSLDLAADSELTEAGKTEDDESLKLRVRILEAEQDQERIDALVQLLAKRDAVKDAEKAVALAQLAQQKDAVLAAKNAELAELRARLD